MWRISNEEATVVVESHPPILLTTWYGTVDRELVDATYDQIETCYREAAVPLRISIAQVVELRRLPSSAVRRRIAARTDRLAALMANDQLNIVVMENPVARSGLTAVQWLTRTPNRAETCASVQEAFARARRALELMGAPWPMSLDPESYVAPGPDSEIAAS